MLSWTPMLAVFIMSCSAAPADSPVRVDLPVYGPPKDAPDATLANPLQIENHPSPPTVQDNAIVNGLLAHKNIFNLDTSTPQVNSLNFGKGIFSAPVTTREDALLETEGLGSKVLSVKENVQGVVTGIFQPQPIVDTIQEEEKYGNEGDKFYSAGQAIVNSASGVSTFVNSILEVPGAIIKKIARAATEKLNNFGGRLVGL